MSTLMNIINKKKAGEIKTIDELTVYSEMLGEDIKIVKKPVSQYMNILSKHDVAVGEDTSFSGFIPMLNEMIYEFCPMFKEPDAVKMAREIYGANTPKELPELIFEGNVGEMSKIFEAINSLYNLDEMDEDIKN